MNAGSGDGEKRRRANMGKKGGKRAESERYQERKRSPACKKEEKRWEMGTRQGKMNAGSGDGEKRRRANMGKKEEKGSRVNAIRRKKVKPGVQKEERDGRWGQGRGK
ncbi:MAG: hypothetical protein ACLR23_06905 [Clostridia bacterium]